MHLFFHDNRSIILDIINMLYYITIYYTITLLKKIMYTTKKTTTITYNFFVFMKAFDVLEP